MILPLSLSLAGCAGSVTAEGMTDGFGPVVSAAWVPSTPEDPTFDSVILSNYLGLCEALQTWAVATADLSEATGDCRRMEEPFRAYLDAEAGLEFDGARLVWINAAEQLATDEYEFGAGSWGGVRQIQGDPWGDLGEQYDTTGTPGTWCGLDGLSPDRGPSWRFVGGSMDVTALSAEVSATGTIDATVADEEGESSDFTATFTASFCEIE